MSPLTADAAPSIARIWNEEIISAIRIDRPNPPVHARNLFHLGAAMYDAWAAYDGVAAGYGHHERAVAADPAAARREAISYAAYRVLRQRYLASASAAATGAALDSRMEALGYPVSVTTTTGSSPAAVGNRIAADLLAWGLNDNSNEAGGYADPLYTNSQPPLIVLAGGVPQGNGVPAITDPNRWQPLAFDVAFTQNGLEADLVQKYVGVTWLRTRPFALERTDESRPWIDPGGPARLGTAKEAAYQQGALDILRSSSRLNSQAVINISPGSGGTGNNPLGSDAGTGFPLNPVTGQPYANNPVKEGDFARVLAEFWADGPKSETPPGHWHVLANQVTDHPLTVKKIGGTGPLLDDLEWDVKLYFALSAATHDAACTAWSLKRAYEGVRPVTMIRYMGGKGQSSNPAGPFYDPQGLPLEPGVVEVITADTAAIGGRHQGVGSPGEIAVYSWPGEPSDPSTQTSPVRWMRAVDWLPYQRKTFNTPAFPGYTSGHSTFSRAAAEVLTAITGSPYFPGGLGNFTAPANTYLVFERGPSATVTLQWATYFDAADQAGQSRRWGGIHVMEDDFTGRSTGSQAGRLAWKLARKYFDGSILTEVPNLEITLLSDDQVKLVWKTVRGLTYRVQACPRLEDGWADAATLPPAEGTMGTWTGPRIAADRGFYRVIQSPGSQ